MRPLNGVHTTFPALCKMTRTDNWLWPGGPTGSPDDGAFAAEGIFGQAIYINRREQVVIAQWGAQTKPTGGAKIEDNDFFAAVVSALR